ncbi:MAG: hypothetical protein ABSH56_27730 [Bryobacteraceae bacterium]|jgi:hypothetical protein
MRVVSIAAAVLVVVALFFGNCLTCPQMAASQSCCHPNQPCHHKQAPSRVCEAAALHPFVKADIADHSVTLAVVSIAPITPDRVSAASPRDAALTSVEYAPSDLLSLHSSFRI